MLLQIRLVILLHIRLILLQILLLLHITLIFNTNPVDVTNPVVYYKSEWYSCATPSCMAVLGKWLQSTGIDVRAFVELFEAVFEF